MNYKEEEKGGKQKVKMERGGGKGADNVDGGKT